MIFLNAKAVCVVVDGADRSVTKAGGVAPTVMQQKLAFMFHAEGWVSGASLVKPVGVAGGDPSADEAVNSTSPGSSTPSGMEKLVTLE